MGTGQPQGAPGNRNGHRATARVAPTVKPEDEKKKIT